MQDVDKAEELKAQMDARGFQHSAETLQNLAQLAAEYKLNLDEALSYKQQLWVLYSILNHGTCISWLPIIPGKAGKVREFKSGKGKVRENRKSQGKCVLACMKFGQLVLRKVIEIVATRCQILRLS